MALLSNFDGSITLPHKFYVDSLWMGSHHLTFFLGKFFQVSKILKKGLKFSQKFSRGFKTFFFPNFYDSFFNDHSSGIFSEKKGPKK
jgi:hypothetical protein